MKLQDLFESKYASVPLSQIQPTEDWQVPIDDRLLAYVDGEKNTVPRIYDDIKNGIGIKHALEVSRIADTSKSWKKTFPPKPGKVYYLHNGHHRYAAAVLAKLKNVRVRIGKGA